MLMRRTKTASRSPKPEARSPKPHKYVYFFGNGKADVDRTMKDLLGGKGAGLAEMTNAGQPVPPGFTISPEACTHYNEQGRKKPDVVDTAMRGNHKKIK